MKKFMLAAGALTSALSIFELIDIILWHRMTEKEQYMYVITRSQLFEEELFTVLLFLAAGIVMLSVSALRFNKKKK